MKKEYEIPQMDIIKFSMDTDIMNQSADSGRYGDLPTADSVE